MAADTKGVILALKCVTPIEGSEILLEVHNGFCGFYIGLASKVILQGFFWLEIVRDVLNTAHSCEVWKNFSTQRRALS